MINIIDSIIGTQEVLYSTLPFPETGFEEKYTSIKRARNFELTQPNGILHKGIIHRYYLYKNRVRGCHNMRVTQRRRRTRDAEQIITYKSLLTTDADVPPYLALSLMPNITIDRHDIIAELCSSSNARDSSFTRLINCYIIFYLNIYGDYEDMEKCDRS